MSGDLLTVKGRAGFGGRSAGAYLSSPGRARPASGEGLFLREPPLTGLGGDVHLVGLSLSPSLSLSHTHTPSSVAKAVIFILQIRKQIMKLIFG